MKKYKLQSVLVALFAMISLFTACVDDEFDIPPATTIPIGEVKTIQELKTSFLNDTINIDMTVYATVTMDDKSGNIYKTAYIQDHTGAIALHLDAAGGIYQGDSIRLQLKGLKVGKYRELFQIDAPDANGFTLDNYVTKIQTLVNREPEIVTISDINTNSAQYQCKLIKLENVQFIEGDTAATYADAEGELSRDLVIVDGSGNTVIVRSSGYAKFANEKVPNGSGSLIAIVGQYNTTMQLYLRTSEEVIMENERFEVKESILTFDNFGPDGFLYEYSVIGDQKWIYDSYGYAKVTGYDGGQFANEDWLISEALDFTTNSGVALTFRHAAGYVYTGVWDDLQFLVSTDYTGSGDPNSATWTTFTFNTPPTTPFWTWADSGDIDLSAYDGETNVFIAFKYVSTTSNCSTWEVDNVVLKEIAK